jgi:hypothetical protein
MPGFEKVGGASVKIQATLAIDLRCTKRSFGRGLLRFVSSLASQEGTCQPASTVTLSQSISEPLPQLDELPPSGNHLLHLAG